MTSLTFSMPEELKARLEAAARAEGRSKSNFFVFHAEKLFEKSGYSDLDASSKAKESGIAKIKKALGKK